MGLKFFPEVGRQSKDYLQWQPATLGGNQPLWTVISPDTAAANWGMAFNDNSVVLGTRNNLMSWGYNCLDGQASREDASEPNIVFTIESNFNTGTENLMELHVGQGEFADGTAFRMLSMTANRSTHNQIMNIQTDKVNYLRRTDGDQCLQLNGHTVSVGNSTNATVFQFEKNNAVALTQLNAASSAYRNLIFLNSSNQVSIASSGDTTLLGSHLYFPAAETSDLGQSAANRPNNIYAKGTVTGGNFTWTAGTTGSILFVGTSGAVTQDNGELFWDNTPNRLYIGTNDPTTIPWGGTSGATSKVIVYTTTAQNGVYAFMDTSSPFQATFFGEAHVKDCSGGIELDHYIEQAWAPTAGSLSLLYLYREWDSTTGFVGRYNGLNIDGVYTSIVTPGTIQDVHGLRIVKQKADAAVSITNSYAIRVLDQTGSGSTITYSILSEGGPCELRSGAVGQVPLTIKGFAAQSSNLTEWINSAGTVLALIDDLGQFVFNETGADADCRIEGDTDVNLIFTDASTDRVGIGTATPATKLDVNGTATATLFSGGNFTWTAGTTGSVLFIGTSGAVAQDNANLFWDDSNNRLGIGTTAPLKKLNILTTGSDHFRMTHTASTAIADMYVDTNGDMYVAATRNVRFDSANASGVTSFRNSVGSAQFTMDATSTGEQAAMTLTTAGAWSTNTTGSGTMSWRCGNDAADFIKFQTNSGGALDKVTITIANIVLNDSGADCDTRVEGDTDTNLLFVDAGADSVGIGTGTPATKFDVIGVADGYLMCTKLATAQTTTTVLSGYGVVVPDRYEILTGQSLVIQDTAIMEIV